MTQFEPDRRFAVHGDLGPFEGTVAYEFEDVGGITRLTNQADLEAHGIRLYHLEAEDAGVDGFDSILNRIDSDRQEHVTRTSSIIS